MNGDWDLVVKAADASRKHCACDTVTCDMNQNLFCLMQQMPFLEFKILLTYETFSSVHWSC